MKKLKSKNLKHGDLVEVDGIVTPVDINPRFKKVADTKVWLVWEKPQDCQCGAEQTLRINPDWFQNNGTPICDCCLDYTYSHTEVEE